MAKRSPIDQLLDDVVAASRRSANRSDRVKKTPSHVPDRFPRKELEEEIFRRTGVRPSKSACERWMRRGIRGQRLGVIRIGGRNFIDSAELDRFLEAVNRGEQK